MPTVITRPKQVTPSHPDNDSPTGSWNDGRPETGDSHPGSDVFDLKDIVSVINTNSESSSDTDPVLGTNEVPSDTQISAEPTALTDQGALHTLKTGEEARMARQITTLHHKLLAGAAAVSLTVAVVGTIFYHDNWKNDPIGAPLFNLEAHQRIQDFVHGCLDKAGVTNFSASQLASEILEQLKATWSDRNVAKIYAQPTWQNQVNCPPPGDYSGPTDYQLLAGIFADAVNNVMQNAGNALPPSQIVLFVSLLLGMASNFL
ncbi:hypothetical protein H4CHR_00568 [Variovorax sp. PBS-H4]|uniref:hypothetical protein n=1 Tax=Variovorax sp. PBS-H4 TaxID=434008 RepID=UPI001317C2FD|nr:hypothetical protein [Variovorax sp. PBS-H4]VTU20356.1 hypothetical protein H4CHR_00568 [Variovorax sp. PBS-H4]